MPESNIIDVFILLFIIASIGRGIRIGFFRQVLSIIGFFAGLFVAGWILPHILKYVVDPETQASLSPALVLLTAIAGAAIGDLAGHKIRLATTGKEIVKKIEAAAGVAVSAASVLVISWLLASMVGRLPIAGTQEGIQRSFILRTLTDNLPSAPSVIANLGRFISPGGFPDVFIDEPSLSPTLPPSTSEVRAAAEAAITSTVKVQGFGCGGLMTGSGFVVGENLVATNAHVIGGMRRPVVYSQNGKHSASAVWFNPNLDFALLRVDNLNLPALELAGHRAARGTSAAVLGFPGGGRMEIDEAVVLSARQALGRNIYNSGVVLRPIYEVQTQIDQGNSGGPVVLPDGTVAGVIFAKAVTSDAHAFAITSQAVQDEMEKAASQRQPVSTGRCAS